MVARRLRCWTTEQQIHSFAYEDAWYDSTDGDGYSLVVLDINADISQWGERLGWKASSSVGGSPGVIESQQQDLLGDFDRNNRVDFTDFLILSTNFGIENASLEQGDADGNGIVDFADFLLVAANFGL